MVREEIVIKGIRQGLLIGLGEGAWEEQLAQLERRLDMGATFFRGGRAALSVGQRQLEAADIERVGELLAQYDIELWAILSPDDETALVAARLGLAVNLDLGERLLETDEPALPEAPGEFGVLVVDRTLRSGQRSEHPGHIILFGDVNAGAEVIAGGHVVVWGKVRGMVHAGALGDEEARVCALDLAPTQLRIAGYIARSPEEKRRRPVPEMAWVRDGRIEAVPWRP